MTRFVDGSSVARFAVKEARNLLVAYFDVVGHVDWRLLKAHVNECRV